MNNLKNWLEEKLQAKGMTLADFAKASKVSKAILYMYLTDKHRPSHRSVHKMADALGCTVEEVNNQFTPNKVGRKPKTTQAVETTAVTELSTN